MNRKKNRQARAERRKTARGRAQISAAQTSINILQDMWNDDRCEATEFAIQAGARIAVASRDVAHSPEWVAAMAAIEKAGLTKPEIQFVNNLKAAVDGFVASGGSVQLAFTVFTDVAHELAYRVEEEIANRSQGPEAPKPETSKHPKDVVNVQDLTKAWIAKSNDPNATPEEREQAKKLVHDYGIGDTGLVQ